MHVVDWLVLSAFLLWVVGDGIRRARGTETLEDYYAAGRSIPWWAAGLSIMATQASAITVIGTTGQAYVGGVEFVQFYFGLAFAMVLLSVFLVPMLRAEPVLTAYQVLERRFGMPTRLLASLIFLVSRCLALGVVIYAPAVVLSAMTGLPQNVTILIMGALTTLYTVIGGANAVIWTDVKQMVVIVAGLLLCFGVLLWKLVPDLGFTRLFEILGAAGKLEAVEFVPDSVDLLPRVLDARGEPIGAKSFWDDKYNFWSGLIGGLFLHMAYFGCDQSQVQRILTNPSARESRLSLLMSAFAKVPMQFFVLLIGALLFGFYLLHPAPMLFKPEEAGLARRTPAAVAVQERYDAAVAERRAAALDLAAVEGPLRSDPERLQRFRSAAAAVEAERKAARDALYPGPSAEAAELRGKQDTNYVFPTFILTELPIVIIGLIIAAIFAAAMSSVDSVLNALSAATVVDFVRPFRQGMAERDALRIGRGVTLFWGLVATLAAIEMAGLGSVIELINKVGSFFYGSLLGIFALILVVPRAGPIAGFFGLIGGMVAVLSVHATLKVEYLWYNVIGCLGVLAVGGVLAAFPAGRARA